MFGYFDTRSVDIEPAGLIDEEYLAALRSRSGWTYEQLVRELDDRMRAFNRTVDPLVALLSYRTTDITVEYSVPQAFLPEARTEYTMARPQIGTRRGGYPLAWKAWDQAMAWTEQGLRNERLTVITDSIDGHLQRLRNWLRYRVLLRLFSTDDWFVDDDSEAAGVSPGFAGASSVHPYTRPYPTGLPLPGGYTHYIRTASAGLAAAVQAGIDLLRAQGHLPPYDVIGPVDMVNLFKADTTNFVKAGSTLIRPGPDQAEALVDPNQFVGAYLDYVQVRYPIPDFTSPNFALVKLYGINDRRNPIAIRYAMDEQQEPEGTYIRSRNLFPLAHAEVVSGWQPNVGNRTAAVLYTVAASGAYVAPTISPYTTS